MVAIGLPNDPGSDIRRPFQRERSVAIKAARAAGAAIREIYGQVLEVSFKSGDDPLTIADQAADRIILERLRLAFPADGRLSEEDAAVPTGQVASRTWVVDPLDGTREFVQGIPEFAVSIALILDGRPVVAVVYNPINDLLVAATRGGGVTCATRPAAARRSAYLRQAVVLASRSEVSRGQWAPFEQAFRIVPTGSIAYKLALVAIGTADATVSLAPKHGWDICAGVLLVEEAGGRVTDLDGATLDLSRPGALVSGLIASHKDLYPALLSVVVANGSGGGGPGRPKPPEASSFPPRPVAPRITHPERVAAPIAISATPIVVPAADPIDRQRSLVRSATLAALLLSFGALIGFVTADVTRDSREGRGVTASAASATPDRGTVPPSPSSSTGSEGSPTTIAGGVAGASPGGGVAGASPAAGPSMAPPVATLGQGLRSGGIDLRVAWKPPANDASVSRYDLQMSRDGAAYQTIDLASKTARSANLAAAANHDYTFRVRARAKDGSPGSYVAVTVRLSRREESDRDIRASRGWKLAEHPRYSGAGARYSTTAGAELSMAFDGTAVAIVGPKGPGRGRADIILDGERIGRLDAIAATFRPVQLLYTVDGLTAGPHVLTIRVAGTPGRPMVAIDRFLALSQP